ncbi:hypothetical protein [Psychrobacillus sp. FSL H8-0510]|uniref:hypothetical protein n=1 Tax=Psychrobacillus sp. FSL H8-0510 TaxID=2921394 RepID=UPI0030F7F412
MEINHENIQVGDKILYQTIENGKLNHVQMVITASGSEMFARRMDTDVVQQIKRTAILEHYTR